MELVWFTCYSESQIWFIYQVQCVHNLLHIVSNYLTIKKNIYNYLVCKVWWNFIWLHGVISPRIKLTLIKEFNSCVKRMFQKYQNAPLAQYDGTSMAMLNTFLYRILQMEIKATVCARKAHFYTDLFLKQFCLKNVEWNHCCTYKNMFKYLQVEQIMGKFEKQFEDIDVRTSVS